MSPVQRSLLLLLPSLVGLVLILFHSWRQRGPTITVSFFVFGALYGVLRDAFIQDAMIDDRDLRMPYEFALPVLRVGEASIQAVIGWLFSIYASWCLGEAVVRRFEPEDRDPRLFPVLMIACVSNAAIGYAVEVAAGAANWWWWNISVKNPFTLDVPVAGVIAWFSVPFDFLLPFLLFFAPGGRTRWWALATAAFFPLHIKWSHGSLELGYQALKVPLFTTLHLLMILLLLLGAVILPTRTRASGTGDRWAPVALIVTVSGVTAFMQMLHGGEAVLWLSQLPLVGLALVGFTRLPVLGIVLAAALPAGAAVVTTGSPGFWAWLPLAYLLLLERTVRSRAPALQNAHAIAALSVVVAAYLFCANGNGAEVRANLRFAKAQRATSAEALEEGIRAAIELCPHKDEFYFALAKLHLEHGELDQAIEVYRELTERIPGAEIAHVQLGNTLLAKAGKTKDRIARDRLLEQARARFEWAVLVRPEHPQTRFALGRFLLTASDSTEDRRAGLSHLEKAVARGREEPDNETARRVVAQALWLIAEYHESTGERDKAISALERLKAHRRRPESPDLDRWIERLRSGG